LGKKRSTPAKPRRKRIEPRSRGLEPAEVRCADAPGAVAELIGQLEADGAAVLGRYREPLGGHWLVLAALPIEKVAPTPYQRDLSKTHAQRLTDVVGKLGRFLDPIIAVRADGEGWWTPNGHHRLAAMRNLGARAVVALVVPEREVAFKILALNTEKAHNLREKSLEVIRMYRELSRLPGAKESDYALEFEDPTFITLGLLYQQRPRFSGGAYQPLLRRLEVYLDQPLSVALKERERRAVRLAELDDRVAELVAELKERGLVSPYLRAFVVARINPLRFAGGGGDFDETLDKMLRNADKFDVSKIRADQIAASGGPPEPAD
jgi:ParB family chromosome partitioning protein